MNNQTKIDFVKNRVCIKITLFLIFLFVFPDYFEKYIVQIRNLVEI